MKKISVYIAESEAEQLRHLAAATGRSQADLIREGIGSVLSNTLVPERTFHSLGRGHGSGAPYQRWSRACDGSPAVADELQC